MELLYNQIKYIDTSKNCIIHRINKLFETNDNGSFYFTYYFNNNINNMLDKDKLNRLKSIQSNLLNNLKIQEKNKIDLDINFEIENFDILKIKEKFEKLSKISPKVFNSIKNIEINKNLINLIDENIKKINKKNNISNEAEFIILQYMMNINNMLDKNKLNQVELGKIMYEKELNNANQSNYNNISNIKTKYFNEDIPESLNYIIKQINEIKNYDEKKKLLYSIIQLDGILINKYVYSIFYKKPLICGHWYYLQMIDNTTNDIERKKWMTILLSIYGDDGKVEKSEETCTVCGSYLEKINLVDTTFSYEWSMDSYEIKEKTFFYKHSLPLNKYDNLNDTIKNCNSNEFKMMLKKRNIIEKNYINNAYQACKLITAITSKLDIIFPPRHFIELVIQCVKDSKKISSYEEYYTEKIKEIQIIRKLSDEKAKLLETNQKILDNIQVSYGKYFIVKYGTLVFAHLLWYLRTSYIKYNPGNKTSCSFFGFDNESGFDYFICIIVEMKILSIDLTIGEKVINEIISKNNIITNFRFWINNLDQNYKNALILKKNYEKDAYLFNIRNGSIRLHKVNKPIDWVEKMGELKEIKNINKNINSLLKGNKDVSYNSVYNDIIFETIKRDYKIKNSIYNIINNVIKIENLSFYLNKIETTCCEEKIEQTWTSQDFSRNIDKNIDKNIEYDDMENIKDGKKNNFITYFSKFDKTIEVLSKENNFLQKKYEKLNNLVTLSSFTLSNKIIINNNNLSYNSLDIPDNIINNIYNVYCHYGNTIGERHLFENKEFPEKCIKCDFLFPNKSINSRENIVNLINIIETKNIKNYKEPEKRKTLDLLSLIRESSLKRIKEDIDKLATKISVLLKNENKNEKDNLATSIKNFLYNLDNFTDFILDNKATDKYIFETEIRRDKFTIQKIREYINNYFRKNISRIQKGYKIKTNINISWMAKKYEEKWQNILFNNNNWLEYFLTENNKKIFKKFKFSFSIEKLNEIIDIPPKYNFDNNQKVLIQNSYINSKSILNVLKHYMIKEMLSFLDLAGSGEIILAEFYVKLFDEIEKDKKILNISNKEITKWEDTMQEHNKLMQVKYFNMKEDSLNIPFKKFINDIYNDPIFDSKLITNEDIEKEEMESEKNEKEENIYNNAIESLGKDVSEQYIEDFVRDKIEEDDNNEEIMNEVYDNELQKGEDVIDFGYDYGDPQQGLEDEGNGMDESIDKYEDINPEINEMDELDNE